MLKISFFSELLKILITNILAMMTNSFFLLHNFIYYKNEKKKEKKILTAVTVVRKTMQPLHKNSCNLSNFVFTLSELLDRAI